ncbi:MAG TPA: S8 family serine peptidase [Solirubrobacterales bacterium]|nr:S8 family serine peptidase [Solirubrobacterales bacterium]
MLRVKSVWVAAAAVAIFGVVAAPAGAASQRPVCPGPVAAGQALCSSRVVTDGQGAPQATTAPKGYGPAQFHGAYGLPSSAATSQTIAIVDAYDDPNIANDLNTYSSQFGLPLCNSANPCFQKVNQSGSASGPFPRTDGGWSLEIALDVEVAHAICPNCKILLVEASSSSLGNLSAAVRTAANLGATEISNSYGGSEFSSELSETYAAPYNQPGIAVTVSSGDNGYGSFGFPAALSSVITVGGTTLNLGAANSYGSESVWSGAGSGCSLYVTAPSWQSFLSACAGKRGSADVAADADPATGAAVYDSVKYQGRSGWMQVGGTSLSSPLIAGVYALAGGLPAGSTGASALYGHLGDGTVLHDVTSGGNGNCSTIMCKGAAGYDGPTGVGTPLGVGAF